MVTTKVNSSGGGLSTGQSSTPFMTFSTDAAMVDPNYQRTMPMVKNGSRLVMAIECSNNNFDNVASGASLTRFVEWEVPVSAAGGDGMRATANQGMDAR